MPFVLGYSFVLAPTLCVEAYLVRLGVPFALGGYALVLHRSIVGVCPLRDERSLLRGTRFSLEHAFCGRSLPHAVKHVHYSGPCLRRGRTPFVLCVAF